MIRTHGLTHCALAVRHPHRSAAFYAAIFGSVLVYDKPDMVQLQTPGTRDVLVLERNPSLAGQKGGILHLGFRMLRPEDIQQAAEAVIAAGGQIQSKGEFCPGEPYLFFTDPDGYEVEIWYELPTPVDPVE